jgi:regulator of protease activity HflC (stomatin/prohibitin superfamily)
MNKIATTLAIVALGVSQSACGFWPPYQSWSKKVSGEGDYAKAQSDRKIAVLEAQAALESAKLNAEAEILRAKGTNEANHIMAQSLGGPENYLRWSYINMLQHTAGKGDRQVIYLPTEAGMPILEAGKR